jgi:hypothetical protein
VTGDALAKAVLYRGYHGLQSSTLVGAYLDANPKARDQWTAFMDLVEQLNTLTTLGTTAVTGIPEPEAPRELDPNRTDPRGSGFQATDEPARSMETSRVEAG